MVNGEETRSHSVPSMSMLVTILLRWPLIEHSEVNENRSWEQQYSVIPRHIMVELNLKNILVWKHILEIPFSSPLSGSHDGSGRICYRKINFLALVAVAAATTEKRLLTPWCRKSENSLVIMVFDHKRKLAAFIRVHNFAKEHFGVVLLIYNKYGENRSVKAFVCTSLRFLKPDASTPSVK